MPIPWDSLQYISGWLLSAIQYQHGFEREKTTQGIILYFPPFFKAKYEQYTVQDVLEYYYVKLAAFACLSPISE